MGCDIHAFVEYRRPGHKDWGTFGGDHDLERCYALFWNLGGVRGGGVLEDPVAEKRGLPEDLSEKTRGTGKPSDYHSHSWGTPTELVLALEAHDEGAPFQWGLMADLLLHIEAAGCEARMVFWFDS